MAWLANLDTRAQTWPPPARWLYRGTKWFLILMGVYLALALAVVELSERRVGLGLGVAVVVVFAVIKGVLMAWPAPAAAPPRRLRDD